MLQMRIDVLAIDLFTRLTLYIRYSTIYLFSAPVLTHFECQPWVHFLSTSLRVIKDINTSDACYDKVWGVRTKTFIIFTVSQLHCQQNIRRLTSMCPPFPMSKPIKLGLPIQIIVIGHWSTEWAKEKSNRKRKRVREKGAHVSAVDSAHFQSHFFSNSAESASCYVYISVINLLDLQMSKQKSFPLFYQSAINTPKGNCSGYGCSLSICICAVSV